MLDNEAVTFHAESPPEQSAKRTLSSPGDEVTIRVRELQFIPPKTIRDHPLNWRSHPKDQRTYLSALLETVGIAEAIIAYRSREYARDTLMQSVEQGHALPHGARTVDEVVDQLPWDEYPLVKIDGHLRGELSPDEPFPTLILDVTDDEARMLLATVDTITWLATSEVEPLENLLKAQQSTHTETQKFLDQLAQAHGIILSPMSTEQEFPDPDNDDEAFPQFDAQMTNEYVCEHCGYEWSGNPLAGDLDAVNLEQKKLKRKKGNDPHAKKDKTN